MDKQQELNVFSQKKDKSIVINTSKTVIAPSLKREPLLSKKASKKWESKILKLSKLIMEYSNISKVEMGKLVANEIKTISYQELLNRRNSEISKKIDLTGLHEAAMDFVDLLYSKAQMVDKNPSNINKTESVKQKPQKKTKKISLDVAYRYFQIKFKRFLPKEKYETYREGIKKQVDMYNFNLTISQDEIVDYITGSISKSDREFLEIYFKQDHIFGSYVEDLREIYLDSGKDEKKLRELMDSLDSSPPVMTPELNDKINKIIIEREGKHS